MLLAAHILVSESNYKKAKLLCKESLKVVVKNTEKTTTSKMTNAKELFSCRRQEKIHDDDI